MFKRNRNINIERVSKHYKVENNTDYNQVLEFKKIYFTMNKPILIQTKIKLIEGNYPLLTLFDTKKTCRIDFASNGDFFYEKTHKLSYLELKVPAHSSFIIEDLSVEISPSKDTINDLFDIKSSKLCLSIGSKSYEYKPFSDIKYNNLIKDNYLFINANKEDVLSRYFIDDKEYFNISYGFIREVLLNKKVTHIFIDGFNFEYGQILEAINKTDKNISILIDRLTLEILEVEKYIYGAFDQSKLSKVTPNDLSLKNETRKLISNLSKYNNIKYIHESEYSLGYFEKEFSNKNNYLYKLDTNFNNVKKQIYDITYINNFNNKLYNNVAKDIKELGLYLDKNKGLNICIAGFGDKYDALCSLLKDNKDITYINIDSDKTLLDVISKSKKIYTSNKMYISNNLINVTSLLNVKLYDSIYAKKEVNINGKLDYLINILNKDIKYNFPVLNDTFKEPLLTITIPSYNCEKYLINTVLSLEYCKNNYNMEIIIVNDGSKDGTAEIGRFLAEKFQNVVLIDKENGGHGSTINAGLEKAKGKYFRLLDGDDYYGTDDLDIMLQKLEKETSDVILTNLVNDYALDATFDRTRYYYNLIPYETYSLKELSNRYYGFQLVGIFLSTCTYKTELLKKANFKIDHHCFYVDMEYNMMGYIMSQTAKYYPLDIYYYYLGRAGQSVSEASMIKNYKHHEKVLFRCIDEYETRKKDLTEIQKEYLINKLIINLVNTNYYILTKLKKNKKDLKIFINKLKDHSDIVNHIGIQKEYRVLNKLNGHFMHTINFIAYIKNVIKDR